MYRLSLFLGKTRVPIFIMLLCLTGCGLFATAEPAKAPSIEPVEPTTAWTEIPISPTDTMPAPTPAVNMIELLHYVPGAGGPGDCPGADEGATLPAGEISYMPPYDTMQQASLLCLYGFSPGEMVAIDLIDPSGSFADQRIYRALEMHESMWDGRMMTVISIQLNPDLYLASGEWLIRAQANAGTVEISLPIGVCPPANEYQPRSTSLYDYQGIYHISVRSLVNPPESMFDPVGFASFLPDGMIGVRGACYPPETQLAVGVFHTSDKGQGALPYELFRAFAVTTNADGAFETELDLGDLFSEGGGGYYAILPVPDGMRYTLNGEYADLYSLPHAGFELLPLPNSPRWPHQQKCYDAARFRVGVNATVRSSLPVYSSPYSPEEGPLAELPIGESVELVDGPSCMETRVWWQVHGLTSGLAGWVDQAGLEP